MNLLPFDKFCIITPLKPSEVEGQLQKEVSPNSTWSLSRPFNPDDTYFKGLVANDNFKFMRIIRNRNSFLPVIIGHAESWLNGSRVYVKMRLHLFVAVFMCMWLGGVGLSCVIIIKQCIVNNNFSPTLFAPLGMFAFGYVMMIGFYSYERNKARDILIYLLNGQIDDIAVWPDKKL